MYALIQTRKSKTLQSQAKAQLAEISAALDEKENILNGMTEVTIIWRTPEDEPEIVGQARSVIENIGQNQDALDFDMWLTGNAAIEVKFKLADLLAQGTEFEIGAQGSADQRYRICGRLIAGAPVLRITRRMEDEGTPYVLPSSGTQMQDIETCAQLFNCLNHPAWIRDVRGKLVKVNKAYLKLLGKTELPEDEELPELFGPEVLARLREIGKTVGSHSITEEHPEFGTLDVTKFKLINGTAGYAVQGLASNEKKNDPGTSFLTAAINELRTPVAVF